MVLQKLGLVDQVLVCANYYLKVRLAHGVDDAEFEQKLTGFNSKMSDTIFHSFCNGSDTFFINPNKRAHKTPRSPQLYHVVDCPPFSVTAEVIFEWLLL